MVRGLSRPVGTAVIALALLVSGCAPQPAPQPGAPGRQAATPAAAAQAASSPSADPTPTPSPSATLPVPTAAAPHVDLVLQAGQVAGRVRELQGRLRQLKLFAHYNLTDAYGPATTRGVASFQGQQGMPSTGNVDRPTWTALVGATKMPSNEELANIDPGSPVLTAQTDATTLKQLQLRLKQLGLLQLEGVPNGTLDAPTVAAITAYQAKKGLAGNGAVDQRTWDYIRGETHEPSPWEISGAQAPTSPIKLTPECLAASNSDGVICASMDERKVAWVSAGKPTMVLDARFGSADHPTNKGVYTVYFKKTDLVSTMFGESIPMPYAICFDDSRCVHFSDGFARYGWNGNSHGCINVRDMEGVKWMYGQAVVGRTKVFIY